MLIDPSSSTLKRQFRKARRLAALKVRNLHSKKAIVDASATVDVSLTSYGDRLSTVAYAIESIAQGNLLPRRFVLWVDQDLDVSAYPMLERLVSRGLEIRRTNNYGPHTKIYPFAVHLREPGIGVVTADDDCLYPAQWLSGLADGARKHPNEILGYRAAAVTFDPDGQVMPYAQWRRLTGLETGSHVLLTGVAGVYYPFEFLAKLAGHGEQFLLDCPSADDLWLHRIALIENIPVRMIDAAKMYILSIPRTQKNPLHELNVSQGRNDTQFAAINSAADLEKMRRSAQDFVR